MVRRSLGQACRSVAHPWRSGSVEFPQLALSRGHAAAYACFIEFTSPSATAMPSSSAAPAVTTDTLAAFSDAWNRHDIDALMSFMTPDCIFQTAAGPDACGTRHVGTDAVRTAFAAAWATVPDAQWTNGVHFVHGDFGTSQWTFTGTAADGSRIETDGIDVFTFKDGKIHLKNVFRKARPNLPAAK
jgi:ketosteroid isomerase-like protein